MPIILDDKTIEGLINEPKPLPQDYEDRLKMKTKRGHYEAEFDLLGNGGSKFRIIIRQSIFDSFDFSVILCFLVPKTNSLLRLRRYNGRSHEHTNKLEVEILYGYHIHQATERYQQSGLREDEYAFKTNNYSDLHGAIQCLMTECGFIRPPNTQLSF